jgi:hypothetical protein
MHHTTSVATIQVLQHLIDRYGLPRVLVSDNGTQFTSHEFAEFCKKNGIEQRFSPPFHPQSNGQAERYVDIVKRKLKKCADTDSNWLSNSLRDYRATPHPALGGRTPAELLLGRPLRTKLSLLQPDSAGPGDDHHASQVHDNYDDSHQTSSVNTTRQKYQDDMVRQFNSKHSVKYRKFQIGNQVLFKNYRNNKDHWLPGIITKVNGTVYTIKMFNSVGTLVRRHANQIRARMSPLDDNEESAGRGNDSAQLHAPPPESIKSPPKSILRSPSRTPPQSHGDHHQANDQTPDIRRSVRFRQPPKRLSPDPDKKSYN